MYCLGMRKYAMDVQVDDVLVVGSRSVIVDYVRPARHERIMVGGYFEDNGTNYQLLVSPDHVVVVA